MLTYDEAADVLRRLKPLTEPVELQAVLDEIGEAETQDDAAEGEAGDAH